MASILSWTISWPWPRIWFGEYYTIAVNIDGSDLKLYELTNDGVTWDATEVATLGTASEITYVDFTDFNRTYVISFWGYSDGEFWADGLIRNPRIASSSTAALQELPTSRTPKFGVGCNFNGQMIIGSLDTFDERWESVGRCAVAWSGIGRLDFRPDKFKTAGMRAMPWADYGEGVIYRVMKLGKGVAVYGDRGKAYLFPFGQEFTTGFGFQELDGAGVLSSYHVAGDSLVHGYIDSYNDFWLVDGKLEAQKLGYREYLEDLGDDVVVNYVPQRKRFYISDGTTSYVLTQFGLYSCHQCMTSIGLYKGETLCGFFTDNADYEARFVSSDIDMGFRGIKQIRTVNVGMGVTGLESDDPIQAAVDYRYTAHDSYQRTPWKNVNNQGHVFPIISGQDFRVAVKVSDYRDVNDFFLDSLVVEATSSDKRGMRGQYARRPAK